MPTNPVNNPPPSRITSFNAGPAAQRADNTVSILYNTTTGLEQIQGSIYNSIPINVLAYGADPTGATDSTTAIQNAVNIVAASGGGRVYFPRGTYLVGTFGKGVTGINGNIYLEGESQESTLIVNGLSLIHI